MPPRFHFLVYLHLRLRAPLVQVVHSMMVNTVLAVLLLLQSFASKPSTVEPGHSRHRAGHLSPGTIRCTVLHGNFLCVRHAFCLSNGGHMGAGKRTLLVLGCHHTQTWGRTVRGRAAHPVGGWRGRI